MRVKVLIPDNVTKISCVILPILHFVVFLGKGTCSYLHTCQKYPLSRPPPLIHTSVCPFAPLQLLSAKLPQPSRHAPMCIIYDDVLIDFHLCACACTLCVCVCGRVALFMCLWVSLHPTSLPLCLYKHTLPFRLSFPWIVKLT